jgi:hypothetical protein
VSGYAEDAEDTEDARPGLNVLTFYVGVQAGVFIV